LSERAVSSVREAVHILGAQLLQKIAKNEKISPKDLSPMRKITGVQIKSAEHRSSENYAAENFAAADGDFDEEDKDEYAVEDPVEAPVFNFEGDDDFEFANDEFEEEVPEPTDAMRDNWKKSFYRRVAKKVNKSAGSISTDSAYGTVESLLNSFCDENEGSLYQVDYDSEDDCSGKKSFKRAFVLCGSYAEVLKLSKIRISAIDAGIIIRIFSLMYSI
jgi:hypothetical protein